MTDHYFAHCLPMLFLVTANMPMNIPYVYALHVCVEVLSSSSLPVPQGGSDVIAVEQLMALVLEHCYCCNKGGSEIGYNTIHMYIMFLYLDP